MMVVGCGLLVVGCWLWVVGQISIIIQTDNLQTYAFVYTEQSDSIGKDILCFFAFFMTDTPKSSDKIVRFFCNDKAMKMWLCNVLTDNALQKHSYQEVKAQILRPNIYAFTR